MELKLDFEGGQVRLFVESRTVELEPGDVEIIVADEIPCPRKRIA